MQSPTAIISQRPWILAVVIAVAIGLWMLSGVGSGENDNTNTSVTQANNSLSADQNSSINQSSDKPFRVQVERRVAKPVQREVIIHGETEPDQIIHIAAQVEGQLLKFPAKRGDRISKGALIAVIDDRTLRQQLTEARAVLKQRDLENRAAKKLFENRHITEAQVAAATAGLESARVAVERAAFSLENTKVTAPVDAIVENRQIEPGDYVKTGTQIATLIVIDPLKISGGVNERDVTQVQPGMKAQAITVNNVELEGEVSFVSALADSRTRTFTVEVVVPNPQGALPAGLSTRVRVPVGSVMAHEVAPSLLSLNDAGQLGVRIVNAEQRVEFHAADLVRSTPDRIWLAGLPNEVDIITVGQAFVDVGQRVDVERVAAEPIDTSNDEQQNKTAKVVTNTATEVGGTTP